MSKKKKTWLERKAIKTPEEWQRINKIYDQRRRLRNQLKIRGAELLDKIHNYRLVQSPGPADALIDEVHKVLASSLLLGSGRFGPRRSQVGGY